MNHTPTPWIVQKVGDHAEQVLVLGPSSNPAFTEYMLVADCAAFSPYDFGYPDDDEIRANAALISQAPRMYQLVQLVAGLRLEGELFNAEPSSQALIDMAREIIKEREKQLCATCQSAGTP